MVYIFKGNPRHALREMEDKRKDGGNQPPHSAAGDSTGTPSKRSEVAAEPPSSRRRGGSHKRKASGNGLTPQTTSSKRQAREKSSSAAAAPIHNGPLTRARQSPAADEGKIVEADAAAEGGGGRQAARAAAAVEEDWEAKFEAEYEAIVSRGVNAHAVPIPAGWFSWAKVHPLEERAMPSFFNGKTENRTPEVYLEIRNWIMRKFHANPSTLMELKDLSDLSVGELDARQEVMEFLDYWGLINYHPFPENGSVVNPSVDGEAKTDSLVEKLYRFETEQSCAPAAPRTNVITPAAPSGVLPESSVAEELAKTEEGPSVEYHCNSCSADCSRKRYHCQKQADFDLCTECFTNGKFDSDMSPTDFIVMEPAEAAGVSGGKWTDQETLLLLEALELYKENWNEIAEHVATKTKTQCILHFVQMPIEETFMDCDEEIDAIVKENADPATQNNDPSAPKDPAETTESTNIADEHKPDSSVGEVLKLEDPSEVKVGHETNENCALKALKEAFEAVGSSPAPGDQFSFAEAGNPVMALAAFLVRLAEPNAAGALVRSSLKSISANSSSTQLAARHCFLLHDPPDDKKNLADSERSGAETVGQSALNDGKENLENKREKSNLVLDGGDLPSNGDDQKDKDSSRKEELSISPSGGFIDKSHLKDQVTSGAKESDEVTPKPKIRRSSAKVPADSSKVRTNEDGGLVCLNESDNSDLPKDAAATSAKESDDLTSKGDIPSSSDGALEGRPSNCTEASKDVAAAPDALPSRNEESKELITSNSITENGRKTDQEMKDFKNEKEEPLESKDNIDKVKRAASTAISAAAVKAKLLADQEEDQIRRLASMLIDKQLHKLESKLAFFSDMESVVLRVKEQMERSKHRLFQERAHIIASRMGMPAPSSRPMQQSIPINRVAMGFANSPVKPPMGTSMPSQRPPISRSMMMSSPPASNTFVPATSAGNPVRPTNQDKISFGPK